jgi:hypothetical protein
VNATFVLVLKISPEPSGLKSSLLTYASSLIPGTRFSLIPGTDMFQELTMLTLKKEQENTPLVIDQLSTGPITKDVDHFLNKKILRCVTELIWSNNRPVAVLATFHEGIYDVISKFVNYH